MEDNQDVLWGIERTVDSEVFGRIVCPIINLFDAPGSRKPVRGLPHGTPVYVIDEREMSGRKYYRVKTTDYKKTSGWVLEALLFERGASLERNQIKE